ncbi:hypothetical protein FDF11_06960 [Clostridium botulinum]|nr:hypothetical protein [Clostridium botulinum]NFR15336.1 hypothetical protein [Clostridium botulinum]NFR43997.1 hypothetical protein [Clostridium botulinum]NFS50419.1 hypothetical protein [Clostridium botulinum]
MNREEALKDFNEKVVNKIINEYKLRFEENLKQYKDMLCEILIDSIVNLNKKVCNVRDYKKDYLLNVLQYELLRTNVLDDSYIIWLHGYNRSWYLDEDSVYEEINLKFLFEPFIELKQVLIKKKKVYLGKVNNYDIQNIVFNIVKECYYSIENITREYMYDLDDNEKIKNVFLDEYYLIKWSEYREESKTIFAMDYRKKETKDLIEFTKNPYIYPIFTKSTLNECELKNRDLLYANFKESKLTEINIIECSVPRGKFNNTEFVKCTIKNSVMTGSIFKNTSLNTINFSNSDLRACNFNYSDCIEVTFNNCNLEDVSFYKSSLYRINFINCNLKSVNFIDAKFYKISFEGSDLKEALFNEEVIPFIHITPEQLQDINIWGELK